jgi:integrase
MIVTPKSAAGVRVVPITERLRELLIEHGLDTRAGGDDPVFGPFGTSALPKRCEKLWEDADLERITLHECRHSYASMSIAAGVDPKRLQYAMGHASIGITLDRYGHLFPVSIDDTRRQLDDYLA